MFIWQFYELHQLVEEQQKKNEDYGKQLRSAVANRERLQCQTDQLSADNTRCIFYADVSS